MRLYEINAQLEELLNQVDPETGELICDMDALEALSIEREEKLEGLALYCKNLTAEAEAIKTEKLALEKRQKAALNKANRAKDFLDRNLAGEKFQTARVDVSYRKSEQVEVSMSFFTEKSNERFLRYKDPEADKTAIKAAIKAGEMVPGAEIVSKLNMSIR